MRSFINCTLHQILLVIKSRRVIWVRYVIGTVNGRAHLRNMDIEGLIVNLIDTGFESMGWIHLAEVSFQRQALVNTVMNLRAP
jgi:hypothetical protein